MMEEWRDITDFEGYYQVSNLGNVKSLDRWVEYRNGKRCFVKSKYLRPMKCTNGYYEIQLNKHGKRKTMLLHRVVANAFIPNPDNLPEVNHIDENLANNSVDNLEWCTSKYNANYGTRNQRCFENGIKKMQKPINQLTVDGEFIRRWEGIGEAARTLGLSDSHIIRVCKHKSQNISAGGYKWEYAL